MTRRALVFRSLAGLLLAGGLAFASWRADLPARLAGHPAAPPALTLYGNVDIRQAQLGFRVGGRIAALLVDEGDAVGPGQSLARLDPQPLRDRVAAAFARAAEAEASLTRLVAGPRPAEIAAGRAAHAERLADLRNAELALERARALRHSGTIAQAALDQAEANRGMAAARAASARENLRLLEQGTRAEEIAAGRAAAAAAQAELAAARTDLADAELRAPAAGMVLSRLREPGAIVSSSDPVLTLSLERPVWVRAYVAESALGRIHPGMGVTVTTDSEPARPRAGTVGFISPVAEFTPKSVETPDLRTDLVYRLRVVIDQPDPGLRQGMPVTVHVPPPAAEAGDGAAGR
ncbi:MAG: hypothetical protein RLZZ501_186 [Pseudomonadota bacterium]|jgi:HlyD family secretion protein